MSDEKRKTYDELVADGVTDSFKLLDALLAESGAKVTFDPYRDNTKGCGDHCKGMNKTRNELCPNHMEAVLSGDYYVPGGSVDEVMLALINQRDFAKRKVEVYKKAIEGGNPVDLADIEVKLAEIDMETEKALPSWAR